MDRRVAPSMDAGQDVWVWEVLLPDDHTSSSTTCLLDTTNFSDDRETKEPMMITPPSSDTDVRDEPVDEFKDIGVVLDESTEPSEEAALPEATDLAAASDGDEGEKPFQSADTKKPDEVADPSAASDGKEEEKRFQSRDTKESVDDGEFEGEEDDAIKNKKGNGQERPECAVFSVGKLKVNGIGALCPFGVAAATVCVFLIGGKLHHHHHRHQQLQRQKIQLQFFGDDDKVR